MKLRRLMMIYFATAVCSFVSMSSFQRDDKDSAFVLKAAQGHMAEIEAAKIAVSKAANDSVRMFARHMLEQHTKALNELDSLSASNHHNGDTSALDSTHVAFLQDLKFIKEGLSFDTIYINNQVKDHVAAVALFEQQAAAGTDERLKRYAVTLLPDIRMHLRLARSISASLHELR